jgi:hypothetical protein
MAYYATGAVLWAATDTGVFKSADGGATWTAFNGGLGGGDQHCRAIAVQPTTGTVYLATTTALWTSTGGTVNFAHSGNVNDGSHANGQGFFSVAVAPSLATTVYGGTDGTKTGNMFFSTDSGATWAEVDATNHTCRPGAINALAVDTSVSTTFYAATASAGLMTGSTSGTAACSSDSANFAASLTSVAVDASTHTTVYAGSGPAAASQLVYKLDTTGPTVTSAAPSSTSGAVDALLSPAGGTVFAGLDGSAVAISTNSGTSFAPGGLVTLVTALATDPSSPTAAVVWAGLQGGNIFNSTDGGAHWSLSTQLAGRDVTAALFANSTIYIGSTAGTADQDIHVFSGGTWVHGSVSSGVTVSSIAFDPTDPTAGATPPTPVLWAAFTSAAGNPHVSSTLNVTALTSWTAGTTTNLNNNNSINAISLAADHTLWAAIDNAVFKLPNAATGWTRITLANNPDSIAADPVNKDVIWSGTNSTIAKSTNGSGTTTFSAVNSSLSPVLAISIDPFATANVAIATDGGGVLRSTGSTFSAANSFLPSLESVALTTPPNDSSGHKTMYLSLRRFGVYKTVTAGQ